MKPGPCKQYDPDVALAAATQVFWAKGYEGTSLSMLTEAMGIGKKSLYDTFGNKRSLFLKVIEHYTAQFNSALRERLLSEQSTVENFVELLREIQNRHCAVGSQGCLLGTSIADFDTTDKEVASLLNQKLRMIEDIYAEALQKYQTSGQVLPEIDPRNTARMLVCFTQGAAMISRVSADKEMLKEAYDHLITQFKAA